MGSTNKTPNIGLPQFVADDQPSILGDFNEAFLTIDQEIAEAQNSASSATAAASSATNTVTQMNTNVNRALLAGETATEVAQDAVDASTAAIAAAATSDSKASSATSVANAARTEAGGAKTVAEDALGKAREAVNTANSASTAASSAEAGVAAVARDTAALSIRVDTANEGVAQVRTKIAETDGKVNTLSTKIGSLESTTNREFAANTASIKRLDDGQAKLRADIKDFRQMKVFDLIVSDNPTISANNMIVKNMRWGELPASPIHSDVQITSSPSGSNGLTVRGIGAGIYGIEIRISNTTAQNITLNGSLSIRVAVWF